MEKVIWVVWRAADGSLGRDDEVVGRLSDALLADPGGARLHEVEVHVEDPEPIWRRGTHVDGSLLAATVAVWLDSIDERQPAEAALRGALPEATHVHAYSVTESVPKGYGAERTWPDGERSPGRSVTTVFEKSPDVDDARFFALWHGEHTPLTFDIHPFWLYVRNTVVRSIDDEPGAPPLRAIVEEAVADLSDLTDVHRFFGSGGDVDRLHANIELVERHVASFSANLEAVPSNEWILRSRR